VANKSPRYTVRMLLSFANGLDINGVCRRVRDSLKRGIIPVIEIETDHEAELESPVIDESQPKVEVTLEQFNRYREVQENGAFNMLDPRAKEMTGLSKSVYMECISRYGELIEKYPLNGATQ